MSRTAARANSRLVAAAVGRNQLARMLDGWMRAEGTLQERLTHRLRQLVRSGALPAGTRLPSERTVADALNVSRNTVGAAFDRLRGEGLFSSRRGDGTYVSLAGRHTIARGDDRLRSFVADAPAAHDPIDLRSAALPGLDLVAAEIERLTAVDLRGLIDSHGYVPGGIAELRDAVAAYYCDLGLPTTADQILVTSGAQQALRLVATTLLEPGATVLVEEPTYRGAIEVLRGAGVQLIPVPSGSTGVDVGELRRAVQRHRPALVVIQSTVHNPTGSVLHDAARRAMSDLGVPVLDDASPADVLIDGALPVPVAAFGGPVITIGSASKAFWGGLRVGWLRTDPSLVQSLASVKGGEDLGTSVVAQVLTTRLLRQIDVARAERTAALAAVRQEVLHRLEVLLPEWHPMVPAGGASCWVRLPVARATAFAQRAERAGVSVLPGPTFSCADALDDHLRIGYAGAVHDVIMGIERLAEVWRTFD
jgi:DNA-binding transcriptional MocR family regulator